MGLDIYAYAVEAGATLKHGKRLQSWRKHYALWDWCEKLARERGSWVEDYTVQAFELTRADIDQLLTAVADGDLSDRWLRIDWRPHDLLFIAKAMFAFGAGRTVIISADW